MRLEVPLYSVLLRAPGPLPRRLDNNTRQGVLATTTGRLLEERPSFSKRRIERPRQCNHLGNYPRINPCTILLPSLSTETTNIYGMRAMPAYLIAQVKIHDPETYKRYTERSPAIIAEFGGRILARGGPSEVLEGHAPPRRVVLVEFPSMEAARAFYHSPAYQEAKSIRAPASEAEFVIVEGVDPPPRP